MGERPLDFAMRFISVSHSRRRGQALLLAVLIMIFAALVSASFIAIVAVNLNQTARQQDKQAAISSATAGISALQTQLISSKEGENWRPEMVASPPAPGELTYDFYWTPLDKAQGWARTVAKPTSGDANGGDWNNDGLAPGDMGYDDNAFIKDDWAKLESVKKSDLNTRVYVKSPDPRNPIPDGAPRYISEVTFLNFVNAVGSEADKRGMLRLTVIGLGGEDARAYDRRVTYKPTSAFGSPVSFARYDANYDVGKNAPSATKVTDATGNVSIVADTSGFTVGQTVLLTNYNASGVATSDLSAVIKSVDAAAKTITLNKSVAAYDLTATSSATVRAATYMMDGPTNIDDDGATISAVVDATPMPRSIASSTALLPTGIQVNAAMVLGGKTQFSATSSAAKSDFVNVAGRIIKDPTDANLSATIQNGAGTAYDFPTSADISTQTNYSQDAQKLVRDADRANPITNPGPSTIAQSVPPLDFNAALPRYRELTQFADPVNGSMYGYGPGLYIDNKDDVEKVQVGAGYITLDSSQLHRLWQRKSFQISGVTTAGNITYTGTNSAISNGADAFRLCYPRPSIDTYDSFPSATGSLEQRGVRGWISPWEFLPRGVAIELKGKQIIVTREDRLDTGANAPASGKAWKSQAGSDLASDPTNRTYRMVLTLVDANNDGITEGTTRQFGHDTLLSAAVADSKPFNGVILADGNVRVRGYSSGIPLTIVSRNNIYIEGSLQQLPNSNGLKGAIALIARKNVVLNPSGIVTRSSGVTDSDITTAAPEVHLTADVASGSTSLTLDSTASIKIGDVLKLDETGTFHTVVKFNSATNITIDPAVSSNINVVSASNGTTPIDDQDNDYVNATSPDDNDVRLISDAPLCSRVDANTNKQWFRELDSRSDIVMRTIKFDTDGAPTTPGAAQATYRLAFRAVAKRDRAFTLQFDKAVPLPPTDFNINSKKDALPPVPDGTITAAEKLFTANNAPLLGLPILTDDFSFDLLQLNQAQLVTNSPPTYSILPVGVGDSVNTLDQLYKWFSDPIYKGASLTNLSKSLANWSMPDIHTNKNTIAARHIISSKAGARVSLLLQKTYEFPLATSNQLYTSVGGLSAPFGTSNTLIGSSIMPTGDEPLNFVDETFYQSVTGAAVRVFGQAPLRWVTLKPFTVGNTSTLLAPANTEVSFAYRSSGIANLPALRLADFKIENTNFAAGSFTAIPINIEATILAHEGSWFVIPQPLSEVLDQDGNAVAGDSSADQAASTRYRRSNYKITVTGNIAQGYAPTGIEDYDAEPNPEGIATGALAHWLDSSAYPTTVTTKGEAWQNIAYIAAPTSTTTLVFPTDKRLLYQD